jgi:hypothetical protein
MFEVLETIKLQITVFWDMTQCSLIGHSGTIVATAIGASNLTKRFLKTEYNAISVKFRIYFFFRKQSNFIRFCDSALRQSTYSLQNSRNIG